MQKRLLLTLAAAGAIATLSLPAQAQPCQGIMGGYGPGYGPGYGHGYMMGRGYGPSAMTGPGYGPGYGPGSMMGYPHGYMMGSGYGGGYGPGYGMQQGYNPGSYHHRDLNLSVDDVKTYMQRMINNPNLKVGDVKEKNDDTITADVVTKDNSLVQRFEVNRHSGFYQPEQ